MKKFIIATVLTCFFAQALFAETYFPNKEMLVKEFGQKYYELRNQLPYDDEGSFFIDGALINKEKNLNILLRLLNDKTIMTTRENSLFERLNINASKLIFDENIFIINAIVGLLVFTSGYEGWEQAMKDDFKRFDELGKSVLEKKVQYYSFLYQKEDKMLPKCADKFSKYVFSANTSSSEYKVLLDEGCKTIGVLSHYADALIAEGKNSHSTREANKQVLELYQKYFDKLSDYDLNTPSTIDFFQMIFFMKDTEIDIDTKIIVNKKIAELILSNKLVLNDKPLWIQRSYLTLLSKTMSFNEKEKKEITGRLKAVTKKKSNIFGFCEKDGALQLLNNEQLYSAEQLTAEEKNLLQRIGEKIHPCPEKKKKGINNQ